MLGAVLRHGVSRPLFKHGIALSNSIRFYASYPPHTVIRMPALSPTMTAGGIGAWQKKAGDSIEPGDVLVEIETDKAQMDFEFQEEGVVAKILKETGEKDVPVGNPIAVLVEEGTDIAAFEGFTLADAGEASAPAPQAATPQSKPEGSASSSSAPAPTPAPEEDVSASSGKLETALEYMQRKGFKKPLWLAEGELAKMTSPKPASAAAAAAYEDIPITGMRRAIATRLLESTSNNPHFFVTSDVSVTKLNKLRSTLNASGAGKFKISVNDLLMKAMAVACRKVPQVNASWQEGAIRQYSSVDISVAVSTPSGLITPIVFGVDKLGLQAVSTKVKELAKKARDNKLKPEEFQGGTISISNMGMNDAVSHFTAIINPPQAAILAVGTTRRVAVPVESEDGTVEIGVDEQIKVTASFDHKVVDGATGAEWIREFKRAVENPFEMLL